MYKIAMGGLSKTAHSFSALVCYDEVHLIPGHGDQNISFKFFFIFKAESADIHRCTM